VTNTHDIGADEGGRNRPTPPWAGSAALASGGPPGEAAPSANRRDFRLIPWFAVTSLICIVLTASTSAYLLQRFVEESILQSDATVSMQFIQSVARYADPAPYLDNGEKIADRAQFAEFFENVIRIPEVLRANIYDRNQVIVWSSDPQLVGTEVSHNAELTAAVSGELVFELNRRTGHDKLEYATLPEGTKQFFESYIPVRGKNGRVIGVAELYKSPNAILQTLHKSRWLVWSTSGVGGGLLYLALFGFVRRASNQMHRQERALVESERMAAIGGMATSVAHNMRNPMASIRSSAELAAVEVDPESRHYLEEIVAQVDRMNRWVTDLVAFSQTSTRDHTTDSLADLINQCIAELRVGAEAQNVTIVSRVPATLPPVRGEPRLLTQVITEVMNNALQAMQHGGRLEIDGEVIRSGVELRFRDDGHGIPADQLLQVFDPLFTRKADGLGVGLPLARRILGASGGTIELHSTEGRGTTVSLRFAPVGDQQRADRTGH
jgi:signal transduction histidine kinase